MIVDVQNDFISGSLAIINCQAKQNGEDVVEPINRLLDTVPFDMHCYSLDWHPSDHVSFIDTTHLRQFHRDSPVSLTYFALAGNHGGDISNHKRFTSRESKSKDSMGVVKG